jgi:hypothetical protein
MMKKTLTTFGLLALASCQQQPAEAPPQPMEAPPVAPAPVEATPAPAPVAVAPKAPPATGAERAKWFQDCWTAFNVKDWAKFETCYADGATSEQVESGMPVLVGKKDIVEKSGKRAALEAPDQTGELELVLVNGNNIAAVSLIKGTNTGPLVGPMGELPPTKKKFGVLMAHSVETTEDGRAVAHDHFYLDGGTFMGQLGMHKMPHRKLVDKGWPEKPVVVATGSDVEKANLANAPKGLEAFNKHDLPGLTGMMADDVVFSEMASPVDRVGKKAVEKSYAELFKAFSDVKLEITKSWAAGDYVVWEGSLVGTNDGPMPTAGIKKGTGKKVSSRFLEIDKIVGGKLKNIWVFDNGMSFAGQLGLLPPPPAPKPAPAAAAAKPGAAPAAPAPAMGTAAVVPAAPAAKPGAAPATPPAAPTAKAPGGAAPATAATPAGKPPAPAASASATPHAAKPATPATPATPPAAKSAAPAVPAPAKPAPATPATPVAPK